MSPSYRRWRRARRRRWRSLGLPRRTDGRNCMRRREFLGLAGATLVAGMSSPARAGDWPERPVKLILPYAPGGATDLIGRPWADKLSQAFGQPFIIENRGGASGIIG